MTAKLLKLMIIQWAIIYCEFCKGNKKINNFHCNLSNAKFSLSNETDTDKRF